MTDDVGAVALTAPEPVPWQQLRASDWARIAEHAGLPKIEHMLRQARRDRQRAQRAVERLEALANRRAEQIAAGEWPAKVGNPEPGRSGAAGDAPTGAPCPAERAGDGARWPCVLGEAHNNPDQDPDYDPQTTVHRDQFGTEFRVARCQEPAAHGLPHCWCAVPEHHKPIRRTE